MTTKWAGFILMTIHSLHMASQVCADLVETKSVKLVQCCWDTKLH